MVPMNSYPTSRLLESRSSLLVVLALLLCFQECCAFPPFHDFSSPLPPTTTLLGPAEDNTVFPPPLASFTVKNNTEHRSQVGTTAVLHCAADHVGENTVSWIRRRDYHLLTVGSQSYSSDERFQVRYIKEENDWQLHIRYVQVRDDGVYECQISSHPPISLFATLHVLEATSEILGGPEKYMTTGGSLRLVCVLRDNTQPPTYVFWYHDELMINYHKTREVTVETDGNLSVLSLSKVTSADSGNYTCAPSNAQTAHIIIHVLKGGETPAAIQSGVSLRASPSTLPWALCVLLHLVSSYVLLLLTRPKVRTSSNENTGYHRFQSSRASTMDSSGTLGCPVKTGSCSTICFTYEKISTRSPKHLPS